MKDDTEGDRKTRSSVTYPPWLQYVPGVVGGLWLVASLGYLFWTMGLSRALSPLGKILLSAVCLSGVAFVISALLPLRGQGRLGPGDISDFWSFLRGSRPEDPARYALWRKFRRTSAILLVTVVLWVAWGVAASLGLTER